MQEGISKKERIIASALKAFSEKGYHQARISEIAENARVAKGTIYLYFRNKEDLFLGALDSVAQSFLSQLSLELKKAGDALSKLKRLILFNLSFLDRNAEFFRILHRELPAGLSYQLKGEHRRQRLDAYLKTIEEILIQGQREGTVDVRGGPVFAAHALWGMLQAIGHQRLSGMDRRPVVKAAQDIIHQFFFGICRKREHGT